MGIQHQDHPQAMINARLTNSCMHVDTHQMHKHTDTLAHIIHTYRNKHKHHKKNARSKLDK